MMLFGSASSHESMLVHTLTTIRQRYDRVAGDKGQGARGDKGVIEGEQRIKRHRIHVTMQACGYLHRRSKGGAV